MGALDQVTDRGRHLRRRWTVSLDRWKDGVFLEPDPRCPIPWKPSVFAPVFYGYQDTAAVLPQVAHPGEAAAQAGATQAGATQAGASPDASAGAAGGLGGGTVGGHPVRVWYPSLDGSPQHAEILTGCGRYPLVVLAHGSCPTDEDHYRRWAELPAVLARSGYVVVVPELQLGAPSGNEAERRLVGQLAAWARSGWEHAETVMPAPATALVGHSWGAGLLGHVAAQAPASYAAYVSLSGVEVPGAVLSSSMPTLSTWGDAQPQEDLGVLISEWEDLTPPAHVAVFHQAGHWDYLAPGRTSCEEQNGVPKRGTSTLTPLLAADIVACFLTRYLRPEGVPFIKWGPVQLFVIARSLRPPSFYPTYLTTEQKFFAGGHLQAWNAVPSRDDCGVTLRWVSGDGTGELVHD